MTDAKLWKIIVDDLANALRNWDDEPKELCLLLANNALDCSKNKPTQLAVVTKYIINGEDNEQN